MYSAYDYEEVAEEWLTAWYGWHELGRDMNGSVLISERNAWLDDEVEQDAELRDLYKYMWRVLDNEMAMAQRDQREESKD